MFMSDFVKFMEGLASDQWMKPLQFGGNPDLESDFLASLQDLLSRFALDYSCYLRRT